jgi:hypothetical protein
MLVAGFGTSMSANLPPANPAAPPVIRPAVSAQPTRTPLGNPGAHIAPAALPPPISLEQAWTKEVCAAHGGSAGSIACYIGLPAGKLALVWVYPYSNPIDGYNVYRADAAPSGPMTTLHMMTPLKPIATQADPSWKFVVLDAQKAGSCFAVTAYHGSDESAHSVRFCVGEGGVAKTVSLSPDRVGTLAATWTFDADRGPQSSLAALPYLSVGARKDPDSSYIPPGGVDITQNNKIPVNVKTFFTGYVHFNTAVLNGRLIAQAKLELPGGTTQGGAGGELCLAHYGGANRPWNGSDVPSISGSVMGNGPYQGPGDLHLDVTSLAQLWANSPGSNYGIVLDSGKQMLLPSASPPGYVLDLTTGTCLTTFPKAMLDVTYY